MKRILRAVAGVVLGSLVGVAAIPVRANEPEVRKPMPVAQAKRIRILAEEYGAALAVGNYARVVDLMYPTLVEIVGGRRKMIDMLREDFTEDSKTGGNSILKIEVSEPKEVVIAAGKQFTIVPVTMRANTPEATARIKSFFIAISLDRGRTWTFIDAAIIDGAKFTRQELATIVPGFPAQLSLPTTEQVFQAR